MKLGLLNVGIDTSHKIKLILSCSISTLWNVKPVTFDCSIKQWFALQGYSWWWQQTKERRDLHWSTGSPQGPEGSGGADGGSMCSCRSHVESFFFNLLSFLFLASGSSDPLWWVHLRFQQLLLWEKQADKKQWLYFASMLLNLFIQSWQGRAQGWEWGQRFKHTDC